MTISHSAVQRINDAFSTLLEELQEIELDEGKRQGMSHSPDEFRKQVGLQLGQGVSLAYEMSVSGDAL